MATHDDDDIKAAVHRWFVPRLPAHGLPGPAHVDVDRDEILLLVQPPDDVTTAEFRESTRALRIRLAREAEETFGRQVSWGTLRQGARRLFTTVRTAVTAQLAMPERQVLDTLVSAGVATDRADAVGHCIRLVGQHEADWLADLCDAVAATPDGRPERPLHI
jgi:hypothetical protein